MARTQRSERAAPLSVSPSTPWSVAQKRSRTSPRRRGSRNVGDVKYESLGVAVELDKPCYQWAHAEGMPRVSCGMNPGESGPDFTVYVISDGATPTGVQIGDTLFQLP